MQRTQTRTNDILIDFFFQIKTLNPCQSPYFDFRKSNLQFLILFRQIHKLMKFAENNPTCVR